MTEFFVVFVVFLGHDGRIFASLSNSLITNNSTIRSYIIRNIENVVK